LAFQPIFEGRGWEILSATSAEQGKILIQQEKPDLIIMDIIMAGEHGYDAIKDLKNEPDLAAVPIIVYSGVTHRWGDTNASRLDAVLAEADGFVDKSENPDVLINMVRQQLET
jgi:CheY-like chemotaxis protein